MTDNGPFGILYVCFANQCRSPLAERLAVKAFADRFGAQADGVRVTSAGTDAYRGIAMHPGSVHVLSELGGSADGFASRPLTPRLIAEADLVLTATREQRAACVTLEPSAMRYTFTLRQFSRMARELGPVGAQAQAMPPAARMRALLDQVVMGRSRLQPGTPAEDDLADPIGRPIEEFRVCAAEIQRSLDAMIAVIGPPRP